jgi:hypothetical protein
VFDQAFRTYHVPSPCNVPLGVRDQIGKGVVGQLIWPFLVAARWVSRILQAQRTRLSRV